MSARGVKVIRMNLKSIGFMLHVLFIFLVDGIVWNQQTISTEAPAKIKVNILMFHKYYDENSSPVQKCFCTGACDNPIVTGQSRNRAT
jgi:hypothetical protein